MSKAPVLDLLLHELSLAAPAGFAAGLLSLPFFRNIKALLMQVGVKSTLGFIIGV